jgi:very-short-patch-repair endonuclease
MRTIEAEVERGDLLDLKATTAEVLISARDLLELVEEAKTLAEELESTDSGWPLDLRMKCRLPSFISERQALESLFPDIDALIRARAEFLKRPVEFPDAGLRTVKTREAVARAVETGKPFAFIALGAGEAKGHIAMVKVSGLSPASIDDWAHVQRHIELDEKVVSFVSRWNQVADELSIPRLEGGISALRRIEMVAIFAKKAHRLATEFDAALPKKADAVFYSAPAKALLGSSSELLEVKNQLLRHLTKAELSKAATQLSTFQEKLAGKTGPVSIALKQFVEKQLGHPDIPSDRASAQYTELTAELRRIASLTVDLARIKDYAARIEQAGALKLASRVRSQPVEMSGEDAVFPVTWRQAWNWARIRTYLDNIEARNELLGLSARRRDLEGGLSRLYKELVSKAAWLATKRKATPRVLQALAGYATAIRRIGQGTGPNATRYRRDAREAMLDAAGAVPCWIMSHARISEAMPPDIGAFDLVIVDEASQSDLWALPAILRGKKILVVGDDKQVSPDGSFIASQRIQELKVRFLSEQPYGTEMTPEKSLYDLAVRVFAAEQVMLREHFRCVPPIIAYANRVFYKGGIQPLRIPKASERIDPPLVDIYVTDGFRDKHERNDYEAQAIADEISVILKNEAFAGRTIGVVSLLGMDQAKHIDSIVRQRCDAAELLHRKFECGEARTFQGSERDIMFLSMVVDSKNCHALSGLKFDQRFNVAASRARDRMYLVRSVETSDLSDRDLRLTLLSHFNKPMVTDKEEAEVLIDQCESGFEREVFSTLASRGYRVIPQAKTGAYRIDMVVEGAGDNRLAIELDGDEYHGPDRWQHDMNRQRVLERAGWVFWRCFASTWLLRKDDVLQELLARLTAMGIEPVGAMERAPSLVEKRTWKFTPVEDNGQVVDETQAAFELTISSAK